MKKEMDEKKSVIEEYDEKVSSQKEEFYIFCKKVPVLAVLAVILIYAVGAAFFGKHARVATTDADIAIFVIMTAICLMTICFGVWVLFTHYKK